MVLGGAFVAAQATVPLMEGRSFGVAAAPGAAQLPDCPAAKGPDADDLPNPVPAPDTPQLPPPAPIPNPNPEPESESNLEPNPEPEPAVPEVVGQTKAAAELSLKDAGFGPQTQTEQGAGVPAGRAIRTVPSAGTKGRKGPR